MSRLTRKKHDLRCSRNKFIISKPWQNAIHFSSVLLLGQGVGVSKMKNVEMAQERDHPYGLGTVRLKSNSRRMVT